MQYYFFDKKIPMCIFAKDYVLVQFGTMEPKKRFGQVVSQYEFQSVSVEMDRS